MGVVGVVMMAVGCGSEGAGESGTADTRYRGSFTVLEDDEHGPQLCHNVLSSDPPRCGGPDVVGWNWDDVSDEESSSGTTWGSYEVTGTWDGESLTLTEPPGPRRDRPDDGEDIDTSPCPEPDGGWQVVDPATTTQESLEAALTEARRRDDFGGAWFDQSPNPAPDNDPTKLILNIRVTGDVVTAERELRAVWGGALCVSAGERTVDELAAIRDEIGESGVMAGGGIDESGGVVTVDLFVDDGLQATYDDRYGEGVVEVTALLQPVD